MKNKNKIGIFYLLYSYDNAVSDMPIYDFGITQKIENPYKRFNAYKKGTQIIIYYKIKNLYETEYEVKKMCKEKYYKKDIKYIEYFYGDLYTIYNEIYNIIKDNIIYYTNIFSIPL